MKILLLSTSSSRNAGGLFNSVRNLGQALMRTGDMQPSVLAFKDKFSVLDNDVYVPLPLHLYNIYGPSGIGFSIDIRKRITKINPDLIHIQGIWLYSSRINYLYSKQNNIPYMISPRGMLDPWILNSRPWKKKLGLQLYEKKHLYNASCIHALGIPEYEAIRNFGLKNPVAVIPNGVVLPNENLPEKFQLPAWKQNDNRKVLLFLSRLHPKKGLENLLKAWSHLKHFKSQWKLIIAGESSNIEYSDNLRNLIVKLNLEKDTYLIGPQFHGEKDITFRFADAFILPSFSEGMPMAVLEAWSYKLPVVMTEFCNLPEGFEREAAIKTEPNEDSILKSLQQLFLLQDDELSRIGSNGYRLVKENFGWDSIAAKMVEVYKWLLQNGDLPSSIVKTV